MITTELLVKILLSCCGFFLIHTITGVKDVLKDVVKSINELKVEIAVSFEKTNNNSEDITTLKSSVKETENWKMNTRERIHTLANDVNALYSKVNKD